MEVEQEEGVGRSRWKRIWRKGCEGGGRGGGGKGEVKVEKKQVEEV